MNHYLRSLILSPKRLFIKGLFINSVLLCSFTINLPVLAQGRDYTPRPGPPPTSRTIAGTRNGSCVGDAETTLTALAPYSHIGTTSAVHPTFAWYVPDTQSLPIEFRLYAYEADGTFRPQPILQETLTSKPGIMTYTIPADEPGLSTGQTYYWQVALLCDPDHPSEDLVVGTEIEVVNPALDESDLWYDRLATAVSDSIVDQADLQLIANLADIERSASEAAAATNSAEGDEQLLQRQSEQLMRIVETIP